MTAASNRREKDRKRRKQLRARLAAAGVDPARIDKIVEQRRISDRDRRDRALYPVPTREEILAHTDDSLWPDDKGYKPSPPDPLLHGPGRASGVTAKIVRRRHTITEYEYEGKR